MGFDIEVPGKDDIIHISILYKVLASPILHNEFISQESILSLHGRSKEENVLNMICFFY